MDIAFARPGRTAGVREILIEMAAKMAAPDQMSGEVTVGEGNHVERLVGEQSQRDDQALVALAPGDGSFDEALAEKFENAIVDRAGVMHPDEDSQQRVIRAFIEFRGTQVACRQEVGRGREGHVQIPRVRWPCPRGKREISPSSPRWTRAAPGWLRRG